MSYGALVLGRKSGVGCANYGRGVGNAANVRLAIWLTKGADDWARVQALGFTRAPLPDFENDAAGIITGSISAVNALLSTPVFIGGAAMPVGSVIWLSDSSGAALSAAKALPPGREAARKALQAIDNANGMVTDVLALSTAESRALWYRTHVNIYADIAQDVRGYIFTLAAAVEALNTAPDLKANASALEGLIRDVTAITAGMATIVQTQRQWVGEAAAQGALAVKIREAESLWGRMHNSGTGVLRQLANLGKKALEVASSVLDAANKVAKTAKDAQGWAMVLGVGGIAVLALSAFKGR